MRNWKDIAVAEFFGTFILVFFGTGVIAAAVLTQAQVGLWQVAAVWGIGVTLGIYVSVEQSGAHLNPAVTLALTFWRRACDWRTAALYMLAQLAGAITAGAVVFGLSHEMITRFEARNNIFRGLPGSERSAMMFGEYFPNPAFRGVVGDILAGVGIWEAFFAEALGAGLLVFVIFAVTRAPISNSVKPILIGATVAVIISVIAPITQAGFNPARDLGPRLVSLATGWGSIAIPGPHNGFWIYIIAPFIGGLIGGGLHARLLDEE